MIQPKRPIQPSGIPPEKWTVSKLKKTSLACTACRTRRCKCTGGSPCHACLFRKTECVFDEASDGRRRYALDCAIDAANHQATCISWLAAHLRDDNPSISQALDMVQRKGPLQEIQSIFPHPTQDNSTLSEPTKDTGDPPPQDIIIQTEPLLSNRPAGPLKGDVRPTCGSPASTDRQTPTQGKGGVGQTKISNDVMDLQDDVKMERSMTMSVPEAPGSSMTDYFVDMYFGGVQLEFPLVDQAVFQGMYQSFKTPGNPHFPSVKWLTIINLVLAIGARYSYLALDDPRITYEMHEEFFNRARSLGLYESLLFEDADLEIIQVEGLTSFYLATTGKISKSWSFARQSISSAVSLGFHTSTQLGHISHQIRYMQDRAWWTICSLELILNIATGRDRWGDNFKSTVDIPLPFNDSEFNTYNGRKYILRACSPEWNLDPALLQLEPSTLGLNGSHFFYHYIQILRISRDALERLYGVNASLQPPTSTTSYLWNMTNSWLQQLPSGYNFTDTSIREKCQESISLGCVFYSTRILISQDQCWFAGQVEHQWHRHPTERQQPPTERCLVSAMALISLLPEKLHRAYLYRLITWWRALAFIVQALLVLLASLRSQDMVGPFYGEVLASAEKALAWIRELAKTDESASRAWFSCSNILNQIMKTRGQEADVERSSLRGYYA